MDDPLQTTPLLSIVRLWIVLRSNDLIEEMEREDGNSNYFLLSWWRSGVQVYTYINHNSLSSLNKEL